jgi:type II secretion system protein N
VRFATPAGAFVLLLVFVAIGFPYDRIQDQLASLAGAALGGSVQVREMGPAFSIFGPGIEARGVVAVDRAGQRFEIERARVRPAWSLSWLRLSPALFVDVTAAIGRARGTVIPGQPAFDGSLEGLDLARLPLEAALPGAALEGHAEVEADVALGEAGPEGAVALDARDGSLALPNLPFAIPFVTLQADVHLGDGALVAIERVELDGPMVAAKIAGTVGAAAAWAMAPLDLSVELEVREQALQPALAAYGLRVGPDGKAKLHLSGTAGSPLLR